MQILESMGNLWTGLTHLNDLFFAWPADILAAFSVLFIFLIGLGIKRIFLG